MQSSFRETDFEKVNFCSVSILQNSFNIQFVYIEFSRVTYFFNMLESQLDKD